jgi:hypothetical protein
MLEGLDSCPNMRVLNHKETCTRPIRTGTSTRGPVAAARAAPELIQKTAMKTGSYHSRVYLRNSRNRVSIPPKKGIPKWMKIRSVALTRLAHEADFRFAGLGGTVSDIMPVGIQYGGIAKPA